MAHESALACAREEECTHAARLRKHLIKVHASDSFVAMLVPSMVEFFNKHFRFGIGPKRGIDPPRSRQTGPADGIAMEKQVFRVLHTLHMCGVYFGQITPDCIFWEGSSVRFTNLHHLMYVDVEGEDVPLYHPTHRLFDWPVDEYSPYEHIYFEVAICDRSKRVASLDAFQKCLDTTYPEMFARLSHPAALNDVCRVAMIFIKHSPSGLLMKLNHLRECIYPYDERIIDPVEGITHRGIVKFVREFDSSWFADPSDDSSRDQELLIDLFKKRLYSMAVDVKY